MENQKILQNKANSKILERKVYNDHATLKDIPSKDTSARNDHWLYNLGGIFFWK